MSLQEGRDCSGPRKVNVGSVLGGVSSKEWSKRAVYHGT